MGIILLRAIHNSIDMTDKDYIFWYKRNIGWILIAFFCAVPVIFWLSMHTISDSFYNMSQTFLSIGKLVGLVGFILYSINMVLTLRQHWLENIFNGLNRVYIAHHITGGIALAFLVFHPLLIALQYVELEIATSIKHAASALLPQSINFEDTFPFVQEAVAYNSGIIAFIGMVVLLMITFYAKLPYNFWLFTHRFLGVAFLFAGVHVVFIDSDVSGSLFLTVYMLFWISVGVFAFIYKTILGNILIRRSPYKVSSVGVLPGNTVGIHLTPMNKPIDFKPGQFIFIRFLWSTDSGIEREIHPFSVASEPAGNGFVLYIKALGDFTNSLKKLQVGTIAEVEGAFGKFSYTNFQDSSQIWIAGGIGITPFLSMARSIDKHCPQVDLFYSAQNRDELLDQATLANYLPAHYPNFKYHPYVSSETNAFLSARYIADNIEDILHKEIFICGPPAMMKAMRSQLKGLGVKNSKIHTEEFSMS
ncbi:MAG: putative Ferredoxin--NAD(+) reductase [Candidatus Saccharibacteria bacterium]|jgi:predicted ferric reductase|nr:putative Ferredoxin--NAD(+) reductase [Candidatus Saccharibacteria bacterium]